MQKLHELAARVAAAPLSVLLLGETGVGKEVFAEQIHRLSPRASKPLVKLNCAAFSETLIESELFGHERGAFTGAVHAKPGLFEAAEAGTVFLDEVGELPPTAQAKLLRVLEDRKVLRIGALRPHPVDFRVIAATNRDLDAAVAQGGFRQDLLFRLNGVSLVIPALRDRVGEIIPLAERFATRASKQLARPHPPRLSVETIRALEQHPWRGNVRELRNVIDRAVVLAPRDVIEPEHLDKFTPAVAASLPGSAPTKYPPAGSNDATSERDRIISALQRCGGNQTRAATDLGISRRTLVNRPRGVRHHAAAEEQRVNGPSFDEDSHCDGNDSCGARTPCPCGARRCDSSGDRVAQLDADAGRRAWFISVRGPGHGQSSSAFVIRCSRSAISGDALTIEAASAADPDRTSGARHGGRFAIGRFAARTPRDPAHRRPVQRVERVAHALDCVGRRSGRGARTRGIRRARVSLGGSVCVASAGGKHSGFVPRAVPRAIASAGREQFTAGSSRVSVSRAGRDHGSTAATRCGSRSTPSATRSR